jgi:hypothetical protein
METNLELIDLALITIPIFLSGFISYWFGVRAKQKEVFVKRKYEVSEDVSKLIQTIISEIDFFYWFFTNTFDHISFDDALDSFTIRHRPLYENIITRIQETQQNIGEIHSIMPVALIYLDKKLYENISKYLKTLIFRYDYNLIDDSDFYIGFFRNLIDEQNVLERNKLRDSIYEKFGKMK